jgi:putative ABC transport system permease protein
MVTLVSRTGQTAFPLAEYTELAARSRTFEGFVVTRCLDGVVDGCTVQLDDGGLDAEFVSRNYFDLLRVDLSRGAGFHAMTTSGGSAVAVISDTAWRTRFASDPGIVGRVIRLDDVPFTVAGVVRPGFTGTQITRKDLWIPIDAMPLLRPHYQFDDRKRVGVISGRLAWDATRAQAEAEMDTLSHQFDDAAGIRGGGLRLIDTTFVPAQGKRNNAISVFALMLLAAGLVLALACANIGTLLLARGCARRREIAVRVAIGASRGRIVRQLLAECLLLSAVAAGVGLAIAYRLPGLIVAQLTLPVAFDLAPDGRVLACTIALATVACFGFGLMPAWFTSRPPAAGLAFGRATAAHLRLTTLPLRTVLVAAQVAIAVVLLVSAGLLVRGVQTTAAADPGFDMHGVSVVSFQLPASYETRRVRAFARQILDGAVPTAGRRSGFADNVPFGVGGRMWITVQAGGSQPDDVLAVEADDGYFDTLGIPIVEGRAFQAGDAARRAVLVNETMARQFWPGASPIGQALQWSGDHRVVGVVKDVRHYPFAPRLVFPTLYAPIDGRTVPQMLVRDLDAGAMAAIGRVAQALEPRVRVTAAPLARHLDLRLGPSRVAAWLASSVGVLGLALATIGVFSVLAYAVEQRTAEIGMRIALGARPAHVVRAILRAHGGALTVGLACGVAASVAAGRLLRSFLFGLSPVDPAAYAAVAALIAAAGIAATAYPARRATRIDPAVALRAE